MIVEKPLPQLKWNEYGSPYWLPTVGLWWDRGPCWYIRIWHLRFSSSLDHDRRRRFGLTWRY